MNEHEKINYVEFPANDLAAIKSFYSSVFNWSFQNFGPDYCALRNAGLDGGFYKSDLKSATRVGSVLVVVYSKNLEETLQKIEAAGGRVVKPTFSFPGGRRFHFTDPNGNELGVWSDSE